MSHSPLLGHPTLIYRGFIFHCLSNETEPSCNTGSSFQAFAAARQNWGNYTLPQHIWHHVSYLTWLKKPQLSPLQAQRPSTAEDQLGNSSHSGSWTWGNPSAVDVTRGPVVWETGTAKTNLAESSCTSVSDSWRPPVNVGGPHPYGWKDTWLKIS